MFCMALIRTDTDADADADAYLPTSHMPRGVCRHSIRRTHSIGREHILFTYLAYAERDMQTLNLAYERFILNQCQTLQTVSDTCRH